jgi:hypothetical protein
VNLSRSTLWIAWVLALGAVAAVAFLPGLLPHRADPWHAGEIAVAQFVLAIFALTAGVGSFALRESLALRDLRSGALDPTTLEGRVQLHRMLAALWALCLVVAGLGCVLAWGAPSRGPAWPFWIGAAALLAIHAPRAWLFTRAARSASEPPPG